MADFPNVVMVVLDTMRRDVLKIYGGSARTPCIEALASDGEVYRNCIAPSPWTVPSHATLFTGLTPSVHGVHETRDRKIFELYGAMAESGLETLAGYLRRRGYDTAGYSANPSVSPGTGFDAGFSHFQYFDMKEKSDQEASAALGRASSYGRSKWEIAKNLLKEGKLSELARLYSARRRVSAGYRKRGFPMVKRGDAIAAALSSRRLEEPFFTFVNFCEMHEPYVRPNEPSTVADIFGREKVDPPLLKKIRQAYVTEAEIVDGFVGSIVQHVKSLGAYERTLFVVTSDHGQASSTCIVVLEGPPPAGAIQLQEGFGLNGADDAGQSRAAGHRPEGCHARRRGEERGSGPVS